MVKILFNSNPARHTKYEMLHPYLVLKPGPLRLFLHFHDYFTRYPGKLFEIWLENVPRCPKISMYRSYQMRIFLGLFGVYYMCAGLPMVRFAGHYWAKCPNWTLHDGHDLFVRIQQIYVLFDRIQHILAFLT